MATHFIHIGGTAENCATSGYVVVQGRFGQNEEPVEEMKNGLRTILVLFSTVDLTDAIFEHMCI